MLLPLAGERSFPSFDSTLKALGTLPSFVYEALEFGTSQNRRFFR